MKRILYFLILLLLVLSVGCSPKSEEIAELREQIAVLEYRVEQLERGTVIEAPTQAVAEAEPAEESAVFEETPVFDEQPDVASLDVQALRASVATVEDAIAHFDALYPELMMSAHLSSPDATGYAWIASAQEICGRPADNLSGRSCIVHATTYLLSDDMDISTVIGFRSDENGGSPMLAINCIAENGGYRFVDPVRGMRADEMSRYGSLLPEAEVKTIEDYVQIVLSDPMLAQELDNLYLIKDHGEIRFNERFDGYAELVSEGELLYHNDNAVSTEQLMAHIKPENIGSYQLADMLGGTTLTAAEAYALVDASPEEAQKKIKTAADVLMYMLAAQTGDCGGCFCESFDGYTWHFNLTAKQVMEQRLGNCGSCANFANYMLKGDYDEVGIIQHAYYPGNGGGHVYNYIKHQGKYYIVDFSWYIFSRYDTSNDFPVMTLSSLNEYGTRVHDLYGGVSLVIALTSEGQHLPNIFGEEFGDNHYYVPTGSRYTVLFESGDGYLIGEMPLDKKYHDWTKYW